MNLCLNLALSWVGKRVFVPPTAPTAVTFQSLTANGTSGTVSTTQLTATFDVDPGLTTSNFVVTGASKGVVSKVGAVYTININTITVTDGQSVTLDIIGVPSGFMITPTTRTVAVYKASALEAPTFEFDLVFPELSEGDTGTFDASYCFAGEIDSYSIATGTLPAWLAFNTSTCVFTYTNAVFETVSGLSITATNAAGSATTNTADWVVSDTVEGQGIITSMPEPYYGSIYVNGTGLVIDDLVLEVNPDGQEAPYPIKAYLQMRWTGDRAGGSLPILEQMIYIKWDITYSDGSPVPYFDSVVEGYTGSSINYNSDFYGTVLGGALFYPGEYLVKGQAYLATLSGQALTQTTQKPVSVGRYTGDSFYYDIDSGLNTNDGRDPRGFSLTNASYVESTGILTQTGAFTGHTLDFNGTVAPHNTRDWIYIPGHGTLRIAEFIDADSIRIADEYKLGADYTGITSSDGPKQFYTGNDFTAATNRLYFLSGGGEDGTKNHQLEEPVTARGKNGHFGVVGYYGTPRIIPKVGFEASTPGLINIGQTASTINLPAVLVVDNVYLDAQERSSIITGAITESGNFDNTEILTHNVKYRNPIEKNAVVWGSTPEGLQDKKVRFFDIAGDYEATRKYFTSGTLAAATTGDVNTGDTTVRVTGVDLDVLLESRGSILIDGDRRYVWNNPVQDGTDWILELEGRRPRIITSRPIGTTITLSERRAQCIFGALTSYVFIGTQYDGNADNDDFEHAVYPSMKGDNQVFAWTSGTASNDFGYMYNINNDSGVNINRVSVIGNYPVGCQYFIDGSEDLNMANDGALFFGYYVANNAGNPGSGFAFTYTVVDAFMVGNKVWRDTPTRNGIHQHALTGALGWEVQPWDFTLERNNIYNYSTHFDNGSAQYYKWAFIGNDMQMDGTGERILDITPGSPVSMVIDENNFVMTEWPDADIFRYAGVNYDLAGFNALLSATNTSVLQGWADPANGDFSTGAQRLALGESTKYASMTGFNGSSADIVEGGDDFRMSFTFNIDNLSFTSLLGSSGNSSNRIRVDNSTAVTFTNGEDNATFTIPDSVSLAINTDYAIEFERVSGSLRMRVDSGSWTAGQASIVGLLFDQLVRRGATIGSQKVTISNLVLENITEGWTIGYNIDGGEVPTGVDTSVAVAADVSTGTTDTHTITYYNIDGSDWS